MRRCQITDERTFRWIIATLKTALADQTNGPVPFFLFPAKGREMSTEYWHELYRRITFLKGEPVFRCDEAQITEFQNRIGYPLPRSYIDFVALFGPGELAETFQIAAPGDDRKSDYDLFTYNDNTHTARADEVDEYSPDPGLFRRFLFFGQDISSNDYAWDPTEVTNVETHEYAIYVKYREWNVKRLADSFEEFVRDVVFGSRHTDLFADPPQMTFLRPRDPRPV
jgi:hypothetical protein